MSKPIPTAHDLETARSIMRTLCPHDSWTEVIARRLAAERELVLGVVEEAIDELGLTTEQLRVVRAAMDRVRR